MSVTDAWRPKRPGPAFPLCMMTTSSSIAGIRNLLACLASARFRFLCSRWDACCLRLRDSTLSRLHCALRQRTCTCEAVAAFGRQIEHPRLPAGRGAGHSRVHWIFLCFSLRRFSIHRFSHHRFVDAFLETADCGPFQHGNQLCRQCPPRDRPRRIWWVCMFWRPIHCNARDSVTSVAAMDSPALDPVSLV